MQDKPALANAAESVNGEYPIHRAILSGHQDIVVVLLTEDKHALKHINFVDQIPLHYAAMYSSPEILSLCLENMRDQTELDIDFLDINAASALTYAKNSPENSLENYELLKSAGANPAEIRDWGITQGRSC